MAYPASPWKIQQHRFANVSSETGQVGQPCHRRQRRGKICSTTSHAPDDALRERERCEAKATELSVFVRFVMSGTCLAHEMEFTASGVDME